MSIEVEATAHAGARRRRTRAIVAAATAVVVVVGAVVWALASRSSATFNPITLRLVQSSALGSCAAGPLTTDQAGSACDASRTHTYALGESLGEVRVVDARVTEAAAARLDISLDDAGRATLSEVTGRLVGQRLAFVADGVVLLASDVVEQLTMPDLEIATASSAEATRELGLLTGSPEG